MVEPRWQQPKILYNLHQREKNQGIPPSKSKMRRRTTSQLELRWKISLLVIFLNCSKQIQRWPLLLANFIEQMIEHILKVLDFEEVKCGDDTRSLQNFWSSWLQWVFFQKCWSINGGDLVRSMHYIFLDNKLLSQVHHIFLTFIS